MSDTRILRPDGWPRPSGYSDGISVEAGRLLFVAGQIGWNPATQAFESDDLAAQVRQALQNLVAVLQAGGAEPQHLVRTTWYVTDAAEYRAASKSIGTAWREIIGNHYPAMTLVVVAGLLESRARVEIEGTAVLTM